MGTRLLCILCLLQEKGVDGRVLSNAAHALHCMHIVMNSESTFGAKL